MPLILIAVFGLVGIFARYGVDLITMRSGIAAHWATFAINLAGSFGATLIYVAGAERALLAPEMRTALLVGLIGGFTTFSSYSLQGALLLEAGQGWATAFYILLSPALGTGLAMLGLSLFRAILRA